MVFFQSRYEVKGKDSIFYKWEGQTKQKVIDITEYAMYKKAIEDLAFFA